MRVQFALSLLSLLTITIQVHAETCFYINSYHNGYDWGDRIQEQFATEMQGTCKISYHYLNAKNEPANKLKNKGVEIANLIALEQPDIVIAADDAASNYIVNPFLKNGRIPVVFVGINWDPRPYGYPMDNATGMTEVWPIEDMFSIIRHATNGLKQLAVVTSNDALEKRDVEEIKKTCDRDAITVSPYFVNNFSEWKKAIVDAQNADSIYLGTNQGIRDWDEAAAINWLIEHNKRFSFAGHDFMRPYAMFTLSKSPEEFGHWAALVTKAILKGDQPWQIPVIPNHKFLPYYNEALLKLTPFKLSANTQRNAIKYSYKSTTP